MKKEIGYNIPAHLPGDMDTAVFITWDIDFSLQGHSDDIRAVIDSQPLSVRFEVGEEMLETMQIENVYSHVLRKWILDRSKETTFEMLETTEADAVRDLIDFRDELDYLDSQIGRPI